MHRRLEPKIVAVFREGYSLKQFYSDLAAGTTVGIVALPLAIAFAIASGVKPEQGLFTAIIAGFVISLLGGSRAQISGPTGAFVVIIYGIVHQYGYDGLAVATLIAGLLLILMGLFRMGALLDEDDTETRDISKLEVPAGVEVFEIYGSLFFGAIERFKDALRSVKNDHACSY